MKIFLFIGQSNMAGRGDPKLLPVNFPSKANRERIFRFSWRGHWEKASEPLQEFDDPVFARKADGQGKVGPAVSCIDAIANHFPETNLGIVLSACGGSSIDDWLGQNSLYGHAISRTNTAIQDGKLCGIFCHQGEAEAKSKELAKMWPRKFITLVEQFRAEFSAPNLPIVFAQIGQISDSRRQRRDHHFIGWETLRQVQAELTYPHIEMVATDDLYFPDGLHLDTKSQIILGKRFAYAHLKIAKDNDF